MLRKLLELTPKVFQFKKTKVLAPKLREEELETLFNDDENFTNTEKYLNPLIYRIMNRYEVSKESEKEIYQKIIIALRIAARHYLAREESKKEFKFSTYFSWWAIHVIKKELGVREN